MEKAYLYDKKTVLDFSMGLHCICLGFVALCKLLKENFGVKCAPKPLYYTLYV